MSFRIRIAIIFLFACIIDEDIHRRQFHGNVSILPYLANIRFTSFNARYHDNNTLRPRQNGFHFPDDILKYIFLNEKLCISIKISLKFDPKGSINNIRIRLDNGLMPVRRQAIIWTNVS